MCSRSLFALSRVLYPVLLLAVGSVAMAAADPAVADSADPVGVDLLAGLEYRHIGPVGNRASTVVGVPGDPNVYYAGAASGGVFKTDDGGIHWKPIFDDQPAASIGAIAVAPSDPNVVWVGTGEGFIRANISIGNGVYRSTDGGDTWTHLSHPELDRSGRIPRIVVHPKDPDTAWVAALGDVYGPQPERGVYRTQDGGKTWQKVLFVDESAGASDLAIDPNNPRILFAGIWPIEVNTWSRTSGGEHGGLWMSRDSGDTWTKLGPDGSATGLPDGPWGKIGLATTPADSKRIYALIETSTNRDFAPVEEFQGVLWSSKDGGESWEMVSADNNLVQRPLYYSRATVSPVDADELYFMSVRASFSIDGGRTAKPFGEQPGYDHHDLWIDPTNPDRMISGHDAGISITTTRGRAWHRPQLPIAQMYHVHVDDRIPYWVYGNRQDGPTFRGPSNSLTSGEIPIGLWHSTGGCEVGFTIPNPADPNQVWSGCYDGLLDVHDLETGHSRAVGVWPMAVESWPAIDLEYRWQWTFPMTISEHDPRRVYVGSQFVHRTTDAGQTWQTISPDLTSNDPELQQRTGGLTLDDAGPTIAPTVFALEVSPFPGEGGADRIWAGTNDGYIQRSADGGATWTDLTPNLPSSVPPRGTVSNVEPSRHAEGTAYATIDRHQFGDNEPYVLKTVDHGATWIRIDAGIERDTWSYVHCVREDPKRPGLLYLGTGNGLWISLDDGGSWRRLQSNLPHAPVHWLTIQERFDDLVVATYGRGFWILDDITPLRALAAGELDAFEFLPPRPAYRFQSREEPVSQPNDPAAGTNPEYGAVLHYHLAAEPEEDVKVEVRILRDGEEIAKLKDPPRTAGLHRVHWNLLYERSPEVKLRTRPDENPHVGFGEEGWRELADGGRVTLLAPPGTYEVELKVGEEKRTASLEVLKDPNSKASEADLTVQTSLLLTLRNLQTRVADLINDIERIRANIDTLAARLEAGEHEKAEELTTAAREVEERLKEVEGQFFDLRLTGAPQDSLRWKRLLYGQIANLAWMVGKGDYPPTDSQAAFALELAEQLEGHEAHFQEIRQAGLAELEEALRAAGVGAVVD